MIARRRFLGLYALLAGWLAACGGCNWTRSPKIEVADLAVVGETDEAIAIRFDLDLANPNDVELQLIQVDYTLALNGRHVFTGRRAAEATLRASGDSRLMIPAIVRLDRLPEEPSGEWSYRLSGSVLYLAPGEIAEILLDTGARRPRARFSDAGRVRLR